MCALMLHNCENSEDTSASSLTLTHHTAEPQVNSCATHLYSKQPFYIMLIHFWHTQCSRQDKPEITQIDRASPGDVA